VLNSSNNNNNNNNTGNLIEFFMFWLGRSTTNYKESKSEKKDKITNNNDNS
jgi:hypothetical protein